MGRKQEQKAHTHQNILASAGRLLRRDGIQGASIARVMNEAGLTVGGFYAHFASKQALIEQVLQDAMKDGRGWLYQELDMTPGPRWLLSFIERYLSVEHRDASEAGCPIPANLHDLAREDERVQKVFVKEFDAFVDEICERSTHCISHESATSLLSLMAGAVGVSRAMGITPQSQRVLEQARSCACYLVQQSMQPGNAHAAPIQLSA